MRIRPQPPVRHRDCAVIHVSGRPPAPVPLPMGGLDAAGICHTVDSLSLLRDGRRFIPVMGEFHYSRWEPGDWELELRKMQAGGINIVSTYVFWLHHEELEGEYDFTGCRDLARFLRTCRRVGLPVWLRIGPWAHGEARNGGFPDWVVERFGERARTNDPGYLLAVARYFAKLGEVCHGMMLESGGPVIGLQLENEYGHVGAAVGREEGYAHILKLKEIARRHGFRVPWYTTTAWGGGIVVDGETLPVFGGYVDAPWATHVDEMPAQANFLFEAYRDDETIGSDRAAGRDSGLTFDRGRNPYLTAELGAGIQVTSHRRTFPWPIDIEAQALTMLGSGANLLGYYMYHGGINPDGRASTLQESRATGYINDLPVRSYDFQTAIRQSGRISGAYGRLRKLHLFLEDFGERLAACENCLPVERPASPEDLETPRLAVRVHPETGGGFLFINNHQRRRVMPERRELVVRLRFPDGGLEIGGLTLPSASTAIVPFNLELGGTRLRSTNASLLCRLGKRLVFHLDADIEPRFDWEGEAPEAGGLLLLTAEEANRAFRFGAALYIPAHESSMLVEEEGGGIELLTSRPGERVTVHRETGESKVIEVENEPLQIAASFELLEADEAEGRHDYRVRVDYASGKPGHQLYLAIDYLGDRAEVYLGDRLVDDWFTTGERWYLALRRFGFPEELRIRIYDSARPLPNPYGNRVYYDLPVEPGCVMTGVEAVPEYRRLLAAAAE